MEQLPVTPRPSELPTPTNVAEQGVQNRLSALTSDWRVPLFVAAGGYGLWKFTLGALKKVPVIGGVATKLDDSAHSALKLAATAPLALPIIPLPVGQTPLQMAQGLSPRRLLSTIESTGRVNLDPIRSTLTGAQPPTTETPTPTPPTT
jgi:hypothetical protein